MAAKEPSRRKPMRRKPDLLVVLIILVSLGFIVTTGIQLYLDEGDRATLAADSGRQPTLF